MKLSVTTLGWPSSPLDKVLADVRTAGGFAGIDFRGLGDELNITRLAAFNEGLDDTLAAIRSAGLEITGLSTSCRLIADAQGNRFEDEVVPYCRLADRIGVRAIRVFGGQRRKDQSRDQWMDEGVATLKRWLDMTDGCRADLLVETHDDWRRSADVAELLDRVDHPRTGAVWDVLITGLMGDESPARTAENLGRYIRYTHLKDGRRDGDKVVLTLPGRGDVDFAGAIAALKQLGYDNWLTFEWEKRWHKDLPDAAAALPAYVALLQSLL